LKVPLGELIAVLVRGGCLVELLVDVLIMLLVLMMMCYCLRRLMRSTVDMVVNNLQMGGSLVVELSTQNGFLQIF
jgi:hypothetical protein